MLLFVFFTALLIARPAVSWTDPKDALVNPRGKKVCLQQCGTSALKCPEAFWKEQVDMCYRCCATWGETVIKVQCDKAKTNQTQPKKQDPQSTNIDRKDPVRELGFS
ncbi:hypothetical protein EK21DRAFT_114716 [Setomelanomma holmii]|uniref:Uncharacterized protein n=1 Tax=Setomelanomma holmii TaxID=210430 RepID=A0A9P4LJS2_9PLEO|nr:hypothetical protein EK21DRAFT_114716 [Setomelanomma holmii]